MLVGQAFPHLRQERGAPSLVLQDHAVLARAQLRQQFVLVAEAQGLRRREHRHLHLAARPLRRRERREARVAQRGAERVLRDVLAQAARGGEAADAAAQLLLQHQRDEARAGAREPGRGVGARRLAVQPEAMADRAARDGEQRIARVIERHARALVQRECRIAHHAVPAASGVARVAGAKQPDGQTVRARRGEKAVQRRRAAGFLVVDIGVEARNARERRAVDRARLVVAVVVRQVGGQHEQRLRAAPQALDHVDHLLQLGIADGEGQQRKFAQHLLQEGQLHLEASAPWHARPGW